MTAYIESRRHVFGVEPICRVLDVAVSTFYARRSRKPSAGAVRDAELVREAHAAREGYRAAYGVRKTWKQLRRRGVTDGGHERVARLMRAEGLRGVQREPREYEALMKKSSQRPCGPPEASRPALSEGAPTGLERIIATTKPSL
jgi:putative transposase